MRVFVFRPRHLGIICLGLLITLGLTIGAYRMLGALPVHAPAPIHQVETSNKVMALTVNVDWGGEVIPALLDAFKRENVKATFFVSGRWAKKNPELVKAIASQGHQIENHGYSHLHPDRVSVVDNKREILRTEQVIEEIIGRKTTFYAPPYGEKGSSGLRAADELGYSTIMWTLDTVDWREDSTTEIIVQRIVNPQVKLGPKPEKRGAIVLMHPKPNTVKAIPLMLGALKQDGYSFVTISELIKQRKN